MSLIRSAQLNGLEPLAYRKQLSLAVSLFARAWGTMVMA